jgi:hypothetical protein
MPAIGAAAMPKVAGMARSYGPDRAAAGGIQSAPLVQNNFRSVWINCRMRGSLMRL